MSKANNPVVVTPPGSALFAKLHEPNRYMLEKEPNKPGRWDLGIVYSPDDPAWQKFEALCSKMIDTEAKALVPADAWADGEEDPSEAPVRATPWSAHKQKNEEGEKVRTGMRMIRPAAKEFWPGKNGKPNTPIVVVIVDANGKRIPQAPIVGNGSEVCAKVELAPYWFPAHRKYGVSLRLRAVQIRKLNSFSGEDDGSGFDTAEGGYTFEEAGDSSWSAEEEPQHEAADL